MHEATWPPRGRIIRISATGSGIRHAKAISQSYTTVILLTVLAFFLLMVAVILPATQPEVWDSFQNETKAEYHLLLPALDGIKDQRQLTALIEDYRPAFDLRVTSAKPEQLSVEQQNKLGTSQQGASLSAFEDDDWYAYYPLPDIGSGLLFEEADFSWKEERQDVFLVVIIPFFLIMATLATGLILIIRWLSRPLLELETATDRFGAGDMSSRVSNPVRSPLASLATAFNQMAQKIEQLVTQQQVMIGAIPHELRTPLNRIRFALDLSRSKKDMDGLRSSMENLDGYVEGLENSVSEILEFSRLHNGEPANTAPIPLLPLLEKARDYCADSDKSILLQCDPGLNIKANPKLLNRALVNLILNASRHAEQQITINAFHDASRNTIIQVDDDGPGIASEHNEQIFTPFFRIDSSRNRNTGGIGLGLALVKLIIEKHGGSIQAQNIPNKGLRIAIRLPQTA